MDVLIVKGGSSLSGELTVSGSKNASLPMMATALLATGTTILHRVPELADVQTLSSLIRSLGCDVTRAADKSLQIRVCDEKNSIADYDLVRRMRASVCVMGPLLAKRGIASVSLPGGCNIGHRPIDIHLRGFEALGADVQIRNGNVILKADRLRGNTIDLSGPQGTTVTGTCNLMSAATLAEGKTVLKSAAVEPEIYALGEFLNSMGAQIEGHGTPVIEITGVAELHAAEATVIPDRIEAATLMIAAAITRGTITLNGVVPDQLQTVLDLLRTIGVEVQQTGISQVEISGSGEYSPASITTLPYPGIPTDIQAQLTALLTTVAGTSTVRDQIFPDRFTHCAELNRMNASIRQQSGRAVIKGGSPLQGAHVMASDLRASAALVLAAMAAHDETVIHRVYHLDRGYEALEQKLNSVGAQITRCTEEELSIRQPIWRRSA